MFVRLIFFWQYTSMSEGLNIDVYSNGYVL